MKTIQIFFTVILVTAATHSHAQEKNQDMKNTEKVIKTEKQWQQELSTEQYRILRQCGTEPPFTGKYYKTKDNGTYHCAACGAVLFSSDTKYDSGSGWPSFYAAIDKEAITEDTSYGMRRIEIKCAKCGSHLGHIFPDGPQPTGLRYCVNSASLEFEKLPTEKQP